MTNNNVFDRIDLSISKEIICLKDVLKVFFIICPCKIMGCKSIEFGSTKKIG